MIDKIDNNKVSDIIKDMAKQPQSRKSVAEPADASLQLSSESFIVQSKEIPSENANAVEEARKLLASGQLDTPENIRAAAQSILKFGV